MHLMRLAAVALLAPVLTAQSVPPAPPPANCELHVIPLAKAGAISNTDPLRMGFAGAITTAIFALKDPEAAVRLVTDHLDVARQQQIITELDPAKLIGITARTTFDLVPDAYLIPPKEMTTRGRLIDSKASCYKELIILSNYIYKDTLAKKFYTWSFYRTFSTGAKPDYVANKPVSFGLHAFPPKSEAQLAAAVAELDAGFRQNVRTFLTGPVKRP